MTTQLIDIIAFYLGILLAYVDSGGNFMKLASKFFVSIFVIAVFPYNLFAEEMACPNELVKASTETLLQQTLNSYDQEKWYKDGKYILCFDTTLLGKTVQADGISIKNGLVVNVKEGKPLILKSFKFIAHKDYTGITPLLSLSGIYLTIADSTLTGPTPAQGQPPTGIAIQVNGTGHTVEGATLSNFATGINIAKDAGAFVTQGKFANITTPIFWETPFWQADPISTEWLGKHVSEADITKVDRIAGKLDIAECKGSVEMYLKEQKDDLNNPDNQTYYPLAYHFICPVAAVKDKPIELTAANGSKKDIPLDTCYFDCNDLKDVLKDNYVSFAYTSAANQTIELLPLPAIKIADIQDVSWVPLVDEQNPGTNGMDTGGTIFIENPIKGDLKVTPEDETSDDNLFVSYTDKPDGKKTDTPDPTPTTTTGNEQASQGNPACSITTALQPTAAANAIALLPLLTGLLFITVRRFQQH